MRIKKEEVVRRKEKCKKGKNWKKKGELGKFSLGLRRL